jgi:polyisoprenoid-binding protein YceI
VYVLDPKAHSTLAFRFTQAGAQNQGHFGRFAVHLTLDPAQPQSGSLEVIVEVGSVDTGDKDRDNTLRSADLFDATRFPRARFSSTSISRLDATHFQAVGQFTLRDVTRPLTVAFTLSPAAPRTMSGTVVIRRLDFGVGQGDWKSTEWVGNEVPVSFALTLQP